MKERLDVLLVSKGFFDSREKAKRAIMAGLVFIGQERYDKAGTMVPEDADIHVKGDTCPMTRPGPAFWTPVMKICATSSGMFIRIRRSEGPE